MGFSIIFVTLMYIKLTIGFETIETSAIEGRNLVWNCGFEDIEEEQKLKWGGYDKKTDNIKEEYLNSAQQATLVFKPVSRDDAGIYTCSIVDNHNKNELVRKYKLNVINIPLKRYPSCNSIGPFIQDREATISCCSEITDPVASFTWTRNGFLVQNGDAIQERGVICNYYKFAVNINHDNSVFNCTMSQKYVAKPRSCTVGPLYVKYKPVVTLTYVNITIGRKAIITCDAKANPNPLNYEWQTSPSRKYNKLTNHVIEIENPSKELNGTVIKCIVHNEIGSSSSSFVVHIPPSPDEGTVGGSKGSPKDTKQHASVLSTVLLIAGSCTMIALLLMILPLCYCFFSPRHNLDYFGRFVPQPEVYFQPKELERTERRDTPTHRVPKRSCAVQVPEDIMSFYAELPCSGGGGGGVEEEFVDKV